MEEKLKAEEARKANNQTTGLSVATDAMQTADQNSMINHLVLLGAVALLGYLAHTVLKHSQDFTG